MSAFGDLEKIIRASSLPPEAQTELISFWKTAAEEKLSGLVKLLQGDKSLMETIYYNFKAKKLAQTPREWQPIINEEYRDLRKVQANEY